MDLPIRIHLMILCGVALGLLCMPMWLTDPTHTLAYLTFAAGIVNLIGVWDILTGGLKSSSKKISCVLLVELALLAAFVGYDLAYLTKELGEGWLTICRAAALLCLAVSFATLFIGNENTRSRHFGWLAFFLVVSGVVMVGPGIVTVSIGLIKSQLPSSVLETYEGIRDFCERRWVSWAHLVGIPVVYLLADLVLGSAKLMGADAIATSRSSIPLDLSLVATGLVMSSVGSQVDAHLYEAGSAAAILLLGNFAYLYFIRFKLNRKPSPALVGV